MSGSEFIRVDLHVHTFPDAGQAQGAEVPIADYIQAARGRGLGVLGITDHNTIRNVKAALEAAEGPGLLVLPGIEVSTHEGHLLGLFAPTALGELEAFALASNLQLAPVQGPDEERSARSMLDLVGEIARRGGLAIPAHVDTEDGICKRISSTAMADLLKHPGLAALEFLDREALETWFTDDDADDVRRNAWQERQRVDDLRGRGLARIMSSDAHSLEKLGEDRLRRTLTRLRLDEANFGAVRNAIVLSPKARCKAEAVLPFSYPRIVSASFKGGFLDGVTLDFSANLTCIIGGRGSGKSTALLAVRAALGAPIPEDEDPDDPDRMPDLTEVKFIDSAGSERTAQRQRGGTPTDPDSGFPIALRLADLGQDESGRLARGYSDDPALLLDFLDSFVDLRAAQQADVDLLEGLQDNSTEIVTTNIDAKELEEADHQKKRLEGSLKAAETGKVEELARWAGLLASQTPLLARLESEMAVLASLGPSAKPIDLDALAGQFGVDLTKKPASDFVEGPDGLRARLAKLHSEQQNSRSEAQGSLTAALQPAQETLQAWKKSQEELIEKRDKRQAELEAQGLTVQAGAIRDLAEQLHAASIRLRDLQTKKQAQDAALRQRAQLLNRLHSNRDAIYERRRATLKKIVQSANAASDGLRIHIWYDKGAMLRTWMQWLSNKFGFRMPRVQRLAEKITSSEFAELMLDRPNDLLGLNDDDGNPFFTQALLDETLPSVRTWQNIFDLQTMRLEDRPRIEVQEPGATSRRAFDHLSAGQQRSVLLSLLLCAERNEPLMLDQPEDHLDSQYIASSVVRHLEAAKERRQVLLATHSANLTVLGDAELVIPMYADGRHGAPKDPGAVDRVQTRAHVCALLEGGEDAFVRRGQRYGFEIRRAV
jgi:hypothetical protein